MAHPAHHRTGGGGLAGLHAGARERDHRDTLRVEGRGEIELAVAGARRNADALAEVGEGEHHAEHAAIERLAFVGVGRVADAEHATDVEHLDDIARSELRRHMARVPEQRLAVPERAHDDVALVHLGHATAGELDRVVVRLGGEDLHHHDDAFLGRQVVRGDAHLVAEAAGLGDGGDLVDDDGPHWPLAPCIPARWWNMPGKPTMREKPSASAGVHSPVASP